MKFDGHVKLTQKAIARMKQKCPVTTGSCNAPMFKDDFRLWFGSTKKSNSFDNYTAAIVNYITAAVTPDSVSAVKLPDAVAFVDLDERWTHDDPKGQRFHFMKAPGENNQKAFSNAAEFVRTHTFNWVDHARKILKHESALYRNKTVRPLQQVTVGLNNFYVKELALALHSLQDSFSPGHVDRYFGERRKIDKVVPKVTQSSSGQAAPIRELHVYAEQPHDEHGVHDYKSGGTNSNWGEVAVDASADLMIMGIRSLWMSDSGLCGWDAFTRKWLAFNPN